MTKPIRIEVAGEVVIAELSDTACARAILEQLPITSQASTWGDEIYFDIGVALPLDETAREVVELGDVGFWPNGRALCLFFGPTPISKAGEIRAASAVNLVGRIRSDPAALKHVASGAAVRMIRSRDDPN